MEVKDNLEMEEQLQLFEAVVELTLLFLTICIKFFTDLKLTNWGN